MSLARMWRDTGAASALEFGLIAPVFFLVVFGVIEFGLVLWTQIGLQHGTEMAARCATVDTVTCSSTGNIISVANQQALGLSLPDGTFTYAAAACGNQVSASYIFQFPGILYLPPLTLTAQACFPS